MEVIKLKVLFMGQFLIFDQESMQHYYVSLEPKYLHFPLLNHPIAVRTTTTTTAEVKKKKKDTPYELTMMSPLPMQTIHFQLEL